MSCVHCLLPRYNFLDGPISDEYRVLLAEGDLLTIDLHRGKQNNKYVTVEGARSGT